ncbi:MAG TPA: hypothetical protein VMT34_05690 [Aggregatilineales bacterium]|nr:hypothetical protein [Aggregatilineales bacterium]
MPLPHILEILPPDALDVIRFLDKTPYAKSDGLELGTGLSNRAIGKVIRRLINANFIRMDPSGAYELTSDGKVAAQQIADYDASGGISTPMKEIPRFKRRLSVVMPRTLVAGEPAAVYIGVNPPAVGDMHLSGTVHLDIKLNAVGGVFTPTHVSIDVPPDKAAVPGKVNLTPYSGSQGVRLRIDSFQTFGLDSAEPLEKIYFDVRVEAAPSTQNMAKGVDLMLQPPRG